MMNPELAVIGCLITGKNQHEIFAAIESEHFETQLCADTFEALKQIWVKRGKIDEVLICGLDEELKAVAVSSINSVPIPSNWKQYTECVKENHIKTYAGYMGMQLASAQFTIDDIKRTVDDLIRLVHETTDAESLNMSDGYYQFMQEKQTPRQYIKTGYGKIDFHTHIDKGDYIVVGGRPSNGKTAFTLSLALNMAKAEHKIVYFSLETSPTKILDRLITCYGGLNFNNVKRQEITPNEWVLVAEIGESFTKLPIEVVKAGGKSVQWIQAEAQRRKADIAFIDYIGLIQSQGNSRYEKMTQVSLDLHNFAQQSGITIFALSQLNRGGADREPRMEDLRESGQIEQDADVIFLLHMPEQENAADVFREFKVLIVKNKEGATGAVNMDFNGTQQQFSEVETRYE